MMYPMISAIIPCYNRGQHLSRAILSVKAQTVPISEIIVVNDGSTDNTIEIIQKNFPSVVLVNLHGNQGAQAARAAGILASKGEWIAFLDADDYWLPEKTALQLDKAQHQFDVVHCQCYQLLPDGFKQLLDIRHDEGDVYSALLSGPGPLYPGLLVKRFCFAAVGYPDVRIAAYQEWDMALMLAQKYRFGFVNTPLFVYEVQPDSISKDDFRAIIGYYQIVAKWRKEIESSLGRQALCAHYRALAAMARSYIGIAGEIFFLCLYKKQVQQSFPLVSFGVSVFFSSFICILKTFLKKIPYVYVLWCFLRSNKTSR